MIIHIDSVSHTYGDRQALRDVSFSVDRATCFSLLGPNGGGKTTLFRILSTLLPPTDGSAQICGFDVRTQRAEVRRRIGVVFQSPSLDIHLTVRENLHHAGRLYGLAGGDLADRIADALSQLAIAERAGDRVKTLSGGLKRRVEVAKCLLHQPEVLLLDEPSTGLDPAARRMLWTHLRTLTASTGLTVLLTTHFMEEAERSDHVAILDAGRLIAIGTPDELKTRVGGECITIQCDEPVALAEAITQRFGGGRPCVLDGQLRIERAGSSSRVGELMDAFGGRIRSITIGRPSLEDVFIHETGHGFE